MKKLLISLCLITFAITLMAQTSDVPTMINYQGRLTNSSGASVVDNTYTIEFSIWDDMLSEDATHRLWAQTMYPVVVKNGVFAVMLTNLDSNLLKGELWFQLKVGEDPALKPRQRIASVVFALIADKAIEAEHAKEADFALVADNATSADTVKDRAITDSKVVQGMVVPLNGIIMWFGQVNGIPEGFALCNGTNGTPDLRNRFVIGAGSNYAPGDTGGADQVTLTIQQMPGHNHTVVTPEGIWNWGGLDAYGIHNSSLGPSGEYMHRNADPVTTYSGHSQPHENRPPYYALCYIMRVK